MPVIIRCKSVRQAIWHLSHESLSSIKIDFILSIHIQKFWCHFLAQFKPVGADMLWFFVLIESELHDIFPLLSGFWNIVSSYSLFLTYEQSIIISDKMNKFLSAINDQHVSLAKYVCARGVNIVGIWMLAISHSILLCQRQK